MSSATIDTSTRSGEFTFASLYEEGAAPYRVLIGIVGLLYFRSLFFGYTFFDDHVAQSVFADRSPRGDEIVLVGEQERLLIVEDQTVDAL